MRWGWYCAFACFMVSATLQATWSSPVDLSLPEQSATSPQIAVDTNGNATAVWLRSDGTSFITQSSYKEFGENWSTPVDLSESGRNAFFPQVAVDTNGNATAVWYRSNGANNIVQSSYYTATDKTWSDPVDLSVTGKSSISPQIAVDTNGNVTAVWVLIDGTARIVQSSYYTVADKTWSSPVNLSVPKLNTHAASPQIAVDMNGNATAVWYRSDGLSFIIQSSYYNAVDKTWSSPVNLSVAGQNAYDPQIAVDTNGNVTAVWYRSNGANNIVQSSYYTAADKTWSSPVNLSLSGYDAFFPQVVVDTNKNVTVVWYLYLSNGANNIVQSSYYNANDKTWSGPVNLSLPDQGVTSPQSPQLAVDTNGNVTAIWSRSDGTKTIIQSSYYNADDKTWSTPVDLSESGQNAKDPQIAVDTNGNATAIWSRFNGTKSIIQSAYQLTPCKVTDISPTQGSTLGGTLVTITGINFVDVSAVSFGDSAAQSFTVLSPTSITAVAPIGTVGTQVHVTVTTLAGQSESTDQDLFTYQPAPVRIPSVSSISPTKGSALGGTQVTITGTNFVDVSAVSFGGIAAQSFAVVSPTSLTAVSPMGSPSTQIHLTVTTSGGTSESTAQDLFAYQAFSRPLPPWKFRGTIHRREKKHHFSLYTRWRASPSTSIARYDIYAREQRVASVSSSQPLAVHLHFHADCSKVRDIPHWMLHMLNKRYTIRAVDLFGQTSHHRHLHSRK